MWCIDERTLQLEVIQDLLEPIPKLIFAGSLLFACARGTFWRDGKHCCVGANLSKTTVNIGVLSKKYVCSAV